MFFARLRETAIPIQFCMLKVDKNYKKDTFR